MLLLGGCNAESELAHPDLARGARVIREMLSIQQLRRAGFYEAHAEAKPSDWMEFIDSDIGVVLWPPREDGVMMGELEIEQSRAVGETVIPAGITYHPNQPLPGTRRQITYRADDASGEIVVEAYLDPLAEPVLTYRWMLPTGP